MKKVKTMRQYLMDDYTCNDIFSMLQRTAIKTFQKPLKVTTWRSKE